MNPRKRRYLRLKALEAKKTVTVVATSEVTKEVKTQTAPKPQPVVEAPAPKVEPKKETKPAVETEEKPKATSEKKDTRSKKSPFTGIRKSKPSDD